MDFEKYVRCHICLYFSVMLTKHNDMTKTEKVVTEGAPNSSAIPPISKLPGPRSDVPIWLMLAALPRK